MIFQNCSAFFPRQLASEIGDNIRNGLLYFMLQKFGFIKRVDKGCITAVKDLES